MPATAAMTAAAILRAVSPTKRGIYTAPQAVNRGPDCCRKQLRRQHDKARSSTPFFIFDLLVAAKRTAGRSFSLRRCTISGWFFVHLVVELLLPAGDVITVSSPRISFHFTWTFHGTTYLRAFVHNAAADRDVIYIAEYMLLSMAASDDSTNRGEKLTIFSQQQ
jgi:hypothetical protein